MKKLLFMVILSVLTLVFGSSSVSFAKDIPEVQVYNTYRC